jgi:hypothetical protein
VRICIFGAGSVGGYLAGFLARGGNEVSVVARGAHLSAIRAHGLRVETPNGSINVKLPASDNPGDLGRQDAVIVTVKAPALPAVAAIDPRLCWVTTLGGVSDERHSLVIAPTRMADRSTGDICHGSIRTMHCGGRSGRNAPSAAFSGRPARCLHPVSCGC